jgi:hypothetical protein
MTAMQACAAAIVGALAAVLAMGCPAPGADPTVVLDVGTAGSAAGVGRLAATANGQVLACITGPAHAIVAVDPRGTTPGREIVAAPDRRATLPVALAFIDTTVLAAVCRAGDDWSLRTWRLRLDGPADPANPLQATNLGTAGGSGNDVRLAVSRSRDWIVITGLPSPLEPVLRAAVAGVRIGPLSSRHCPDVPSGRHPVAVTVGPLDELVLFEREAAGISPAGADPVPGGDVVSFHDPTGTCLLRLDTGLTDIRDAAFAPGHAGLWVAAGGPAEQGEQPRPGGLWRLDATLRGARQVIAAVPIGPVPAALAVACPTEHLLFATQARGQSLRLVRIPLSCGDQP